MASNIELAGLLWSRSSSATHQIQHAVLLMRHAAMALAQVPAMIRLVDALAQLDEARRQAGQPVLGSPPAEHRTERMSELLPLLDTQEKSGFSFYWSLGAISTWSILEATLHDLLLLLVANDRSLLQQSDVKEIKVSVSDFESMTPDERSSFVISELRKKLGRKPGIGKFEDLLSIFKLGGAVDDDVRRHILELSVVRNVILHRNGVMDVKASGDCPWLRAKPGDELLVDGQMLLLYAISACWYIVEVVRRFRCHLGLTVDAEEQCLKVLLSSLAHPNAPGTLEGHSRSTANADGQDSINRSAPSP